MVQCTVCFLYIGPDKQGKFIERMKPKEIGSRGSFLDLHILLRSGAMHCMHCMHTAPHPHLANQWKIFESSNVGAKKYAKLYWIHQFLGAHVLRALKLRVCSNTMGVSDGKKQCVIKKIPDLTEKCSLKSG